VEQFKHLGTTLTNQNSTQEEIKSRLKSGNYLLSFGAEYFFPSLLSKNIKITAHRTVVLPVVCMGAKLGS